MAIFFRVYIKLHPTQRSDIRFGIKICFIKKHIEDFANYNLSLFPVGDYSFDNLLRLLLQISIRSRWKRS